MRRMCLATCEDMKFETQNVKEEESAEVSSFLHSDPLLSRAMAEGWRSVCEKAAGAHVRLDVPAFAMLQSSLGIGLLARTARSIGLISVCFPS